MSTSPAIPCSTKIVASPIVTTLSARSGASDNVASRPAADRTKRTRASGLSLRAPESARSRISFAQSVNSSTAVTGAAEWDSLFVFAAMTKLFFAPAKIVFPCVQPPLLVHAAKEMR
jgi:hypothetical protein